MSRPDKINMFTPVEETDLIYVDTLEALQRMRETLNTQDLFGFDLEHHGERSYEGFTCLMQISTRSADYVIDTILLREHIHILKEPFENFKIVKVCITFSVFHTCLGSPSRLFTCFKANFRSLMEPIQISTGCSEILGYMWSICSILFLLLAF